MAYYSKMHLTSIYTEPFMQLVRASRMESLDPNFPLNKLPTHHMSSCDNGNYTSP